MKYTKRVSIAVSLLVASPALAQQAPDEPSAAQYPPLIIEAEAGSGGADFVPGSDGSASFVEIAPSAATPGAPGSAARVLTYAIQLPAPGEYELYARVRVGPGGGSDDSLFYASSFGEKDPLNESDWIIANNLANVGYQLPDQIVAGDFGLPLGAGFRWINLSEYNGGEAPVRFSVGEGALAQSLQIGAREDGLAIDKLAFVASDVSQTVAELDAGLPGHILPPPPPPRACVSRGPALAANQSKFLGCAYSTAQQPNFAAYFNQVTPENGGKWGSVEAVRDVMNWTDLDAAYNFAKQNGLPIKMHTLIWGNQQPAWIETLPAAEQLQEIEEWFAAVAERYPDLDQVDVVNEPLHDPPTQAGNGGGNYAEALGGAGATGWDWVLTSFRMARRYFPSSELLINDYSIINNPADVERYKQIIELLQAEDLIDGVGEQGHAFSTRGDAAVMAASLDSLAELGLPIYITELDIDGPTDEVQLAEYQRLFPLFWEHPAVAGITLWGYLPGHWRTAQGAFLALAGGTERPALQWLRQYLGSPASVPVLSGQRLVVSERAQPGQLIGVAQADAAAANHWLILGGTGADSFEIDADSGELRVATGARLEAATTPELTLELVARDECNSTPLLVEVHGNTAPVVSAGQLIALDAELQPAGSVQALDAEGDVLHYEIVGGSAADSFRIDPGTGALAPSRGLRLDAGEQTLLVTASDGELTSEPALVTITLPSRVALCAGGQTLLAPRSLASLALHLGAELGRCDTPPPSWTDSVRSWLLQLLQRLE
jgi:endo-1,4-beta-xylanase